MREHITLECTECKNRNYMSTRDKKKTTERIQKKKFCPHDRKHTLHKEVK